MNDQPKTSLAGQQILIVVAQREFRDEEYQVPKEIFLEHGFKVVTASQRQGECEGKLGLKTWAEMAVDEVNPENFEIIVFVGGPGAAHYFHDEEALNLAREADKNGKVVAAICIAPSILANAGILEGKRVTAFESEKANLEAKGAIFTGNPVETDGNIITANGPAAAQEFGQAIVRVVNK